MMHVLLTRPQGSNTYLVKSLEQAGIATTEAPLIEIISCQDVMLDQKVDRADEIVFVSVRAVDGFVAQRPGLALEDKLCYAIGQATHDRLLHYQIPSHMPLPPYTSENLYRMMQCSTTHPRQVLIVRGVGGREYLAQNLKRDQVHVDYAELYQRVRPKIDKAAVLGLWKQRGISTVLITSGFVLKFFVHDTKYQDESWLSQLQFVVPSLRLQQEAYAMGLVHVFVASGADDVSLLTQIYALNHVKDGKGSIDE